MRSDGAASAGARRQLRRYRRPLAAGFAGLAVFLSVRALAPPAAATTTVLVAAADLAAGTVIRDEDLATAELAGPLPGPAPLDREAAAGRVVTGPMRAGEPITETRVAGPGLVAGLPGGLVAAPVRLADPGEAALLKAGDLVDVLAASGGGYTADQPAAETPARVVARAARVLVAPQAAPGADSAVGPASTAAAGVGPLAVLAVDQPTALALAGAAARSRLSIVLRP